MSGTPPTPSPNGRLGAAAEDDLRQLLAVLAAEMARLRADVAGLLEAVRGGAGGLPFDPTPAEQLVSLNQIGALVNRTKDTMRHYVPRMPPARHAGVRNHAALWAWDEVRPWLEGQFGRRLPERFPSWEPPAGEEAEG